MSRAGSRRRTNCARITGFHTIGAKSRFPKVLKTLETKTRKGTIGEDAGSLQAGGHRFDPGHVHQLYFVRFFNLRRNLQRLAGRKFWSIWSNNHRNGESAADSFGLREACFQFLVKVRVDFRHRLRLMGHPEIIDVFQTTSATKLRLTETLECVPAHSFHAQFQFDETRREPAVFQVPI
jgi:hypothetical protein